FGVEEAVAWHGGEAKAMRDAFLQLSSEDRAAVVAFIQSL
ncbi:MAG: di-heme oxidoredictase family protein, partial [Myxococcota bacterium]